MIAKLKQPNKKQPRLLQTLATALTALLAAPAAQAASQTWTNAPVSGAWNNTNNWIARAVPGNLNQTANNTGSGDVATFNTPIPVSGIGGAASPITPDDATNGGRARGVSGITFDTTNCGAYVISSPSPYLLNSNGVLWVSHNGTIQMTALVTNTETILEPMNVFLPSSTDGKYTVMNNSTNPNAALLISSLAWAGTGGRSVNYVLDGTNTANNTVTNLSNSTSTGAGGITKQGPGTWVLAGPGTFASAKAININAGTLIVKDAGVFGLAATANINSNGVLRVDGVTLTTATLTLKNSGTLRMNGSATVNGITVATALGTTPTLATTSAGDVLTVGNGSATLKAGAADSLLHVAGPGTVSLAYDATYIGKWSVDAGTLSVGNVAALGTGANVNIAAGAILDVSPLGATTYTLSTTGLGGSGTGIGGTAATLKADPGAIIDLATGAKAVNLVFAPTTFNGDTAHPALYVSQGTLALSGNAFNINNTSGTALGLGTYRLIQQASGNVTDGGGYAANITGSGKVAGAVASIVVSGGNVNLVISAYVAQNLVWTGGANALWNLNTDANWLKGALASVFTSSDNVTFNSVGSTNPTVTVVGTELPTSVTVDTTAANYAFSGSGQIAGGATITKVGTGTLVINTVNTYTGGTVVSNGVIQLGAVNALSSTGSGDVQVYGSGILDLNGQNQQVNGLAGDGTVDTVGGGAPVLTVGNNDNSGTFYGHLQNTAGALGLTKIGIGTEVLTASNSFSGPTTITAGTLAVNNLNALGASDLTLGGGTLDVRTSLNLNSLAGSSGTIANNSSTVTNTITITGASSTAFSGNIVDGASGKVALTLLSGTLRINAANTYSGGTIVASGATLNIYNSPSAITGALIASNSATLGLIGGSSSPGTPTSVTTVDGGTVTFNSGALGEIWGSQFLGSATTTNVFTQPVSAGGTTSFQNFYGLVRLTAPASGGFRFFNGGGVSGGDNATFEFDGANVFTRDSQTVVLGAITGGSSSSSIAGSSTAGAVATYIIGTKNLSTTFEGGMYGANNVVKAGSAMLTLDGATVTTNTDSATYTNYLYAPIISYSGTTTVSNGVLALVVPNNLSNSSAITLAGTGAVLDASKMGYLVNQLDDTLTVTNTVLVTNGVFTLQATNGSGIAQTLNGFGTLTGSLVAQANTTLNPGNPTGNIANGTTTGVLNVSGNANLQGAVNLRLNRTNAVNADELTAASFTIGGTATLVVTNIGDTFQGGEVFHLFNHPVSFATVTLPTVSSPLSLTNKLAIDGTIAILGSLVNTNSTNITFSVSGSTLSLSWPADHLGWTLQQQTNSLATGLGTNWVDVAGSASITATNIAVDPTKPAVFYRLKYQP